MVSRRRRLGLLAALAAARSRLTCTAADVSGAARIKPTMPKRLPPAIVTTRTARGLSSSVAPNASGWTICCSVPLASRTTIRIATRPPGAGCRRVMVRSA